MRPHPLGHIELERLKYCTIISCIGRVVLGESANRLEELGMGELAAHRRVILDLTAVTQIDARAVGIFARLQHRGIAEHCPVVIVGADARVQRMLQVVQVEAADTPGAGDPTGPLPPGPESWCAGIR